MVGTVRSRVVLEGMNLSAADSPDRAPIEAAKIDNQIRRNPAHVFVKFFRPVNLRPDVAPTILNIFGLTVPADMEGKTLAE
jgi:hypothetical protein